MKPGCFLPREVSIREGVLGRVSFGLVWSWLRLEWRPRLKFRARSGDRTKAENAIRAVAGATGILFIFIVWRSSCGRVIPEFSAGGLAGMTEPEPCFGGDPGQRRIYGFGRGLAKAI